jgi:hypothetical protein
LIVSAAIAGMLDITPNAAKATMQPKADAAANANNDKPKTNAKPSA